MSTPETHLHGRRLTAARCGWVAVTLLVLALSALALPRAYTLLHSVCQSGAQCLDGQLTPSDVRLLQQLGLSPGFLAGYGVAWDIGTVLIDCALAALLFWRRSADRMALFCAYMLVLTGGATYTSLLDLGLRTQGGAWYWLVGTLETVAQVSFLTFFLIFPSGRFVPRWTRLAVPVFVLAEAHYVFFTDPAHAEQSGPFDFLLYAIIVLCLVWLQIYRYRRASSFRERQQTKWVVFGFSLAILAFVFTFLLGHFLISEETLQSPVVQTLVISTLSDITLLLIPVSIAIAILRSQLYDIDVIIRRTLAYGTLTAFLAAFYFGSVLLLETVLRPLVGENNDAAIVVSTLAIAALFNPVRGRIQGFIDRRFYRRKYDAVRTLQTFSATLRDEVDLGTLTERLSAVVEETMRPAHVSLWLARPAADAVERKGE